MCGRVVQIQPSKEREKKTKTEKAYKLRLWKTIISQPLLGELSTYMVRTKREDGKYSGGEALMSAFNHKQRLPLSLAADKY